MNKFIFLFVIGALSYNTAFAADNDTSSSRYRAETKIYVYNESDIIFHCKMEEGEPKELHDEVPAPYTQAPGFMIIKDYSKKFHPTVQGTVQCSGVYVPESGGQTQDVNFTLNYVISYSDVAPNYRKSCSLDSHSGPINVDLKTKNKDNADTFRCITNVSVDNTQ